MKFQIHNMPLAYIAFDDGGITDIEWDAIVKYLAEESDRDSIDSELFVHKCYGDPQGGFYISLFGDDENDSRIRNLSDRVPKTLVDILRSAAEDGYKYIRIPGF